MPTPEIRYWWHPESDSLLMTTDGEDLCEFDDTGCLEEVTREQYLKLEAEYYGL